LLVTTTVDNSFTHFHVLFLRLLLLLLLLFFKFPPPPLVVLPRSLA
jgi:hypothetical protein